MALGHATVTHFWLTRMLTASNHVTLRWHTGVGAKNKACLARDETTESLPSFRPS
jgi:hypothetical protein